jgi:multiple sugar transport system permease protein
MRWMLAGPVAAALALAAEARGQIGVEPAEARRLVVMVDERGFESWPGLHALEREFEARYPGLDVQMVEQSGAVGQQDKSRFMLAGDLQLDVTRIDVTEFGAFLAEGALVDLEPFFAADARWNADEYLPVIDGLRDARGRLYGLTSTFTPYVMYFNRDLLRAAGVPEPRAGWTWDEWLDACRKTTRDTDGDGRIDQYGISLTQWLQAVTPWIWQSGGDLLDEKLERSRLHEPEAVRALQFVRDLLHTERVASFDASFEVTYSQGLFQAGRAAFYGPVGYWETYRFKYIDSFEWDVAPLPRGEREATAIAMTAYVVPRTSREPQLAYEMVRALAGREFQGLLARIGNGAPGLRAAAESTDFLDPVRPPQSEHVFLDVLPTARFMPPLANWRKIQDLCAAELSQILLAPRCDVAATCASMSRKVDEHLARERERASRPRLPSGTVEASFALAIVAALALWLSMRASKRGRLGELEDRAAYKLLAPWAIGAAVFFLGPAAATIALSLSEWSPLRPLDDARWIGLENYARLAADPTFAASVRATLLYALLSVPIGLVLALALALLLREDDRWSGVTRTVVYAPSILSPVVVAILWRFVLDPDQGLLNEQLARLGLPTPAWTRDTDAVMPAFVVMSCWSVGAQMLVFLAALKALDPSLEDAARVDGAGWWRRLFHVTLPQLSPVVLFNLLIGMLGAFQVFAQPYLLTQGGPGDATRFVVLYLYESGFRHLDMGYASAIAWVLFAFLAFATLLVVRASRRWVHYAARRT